MCVAPWHAEQAFWNTMLRLQSLYGRRWFLGLVVLAIAFASVGAVMTSIAGIYRPLDAFYEAMCVNVKKQPLFWWCDSVDTEPANTTQVIK